MIDLSSKLGPRPIDALAFLDLMEQLESVPTGKVDAFVDAADNWSQRVNADFESAGLMRRFDTAMASISASTLDLFAHVLARQVMTNRIAILALGVRKYQLEQGRLPENLESLAQVGIDVSKLRPLGKRPFGYRIKDGEAVLWAFAPPPSIGALTQVPDAPPLVDKANQENAIWVWRMEGP